MRVNDLVTAAVATLAIPSEQFYASEGNVQVILTSFQS